MAGWLALLLWLAGCAAKKAEASETLLELTDQSLPAALQAHSLMLLTIGVPNCELCDGVARKVRVSSAMGELAR